MAEKKRRAPEEGPRGVDRWTSNGYGITVGGKKVEPPKDGERPEPEKKAVDEIEEIG